MDIIACAGYLLLSVDDEVQSDIADKLFEIVYRPRSVTEMTALASYPTLEDNEKKLQLVLKKCSTFVASLNTDDDERYDSIAHEIDCLIQANDDD